jgi:diguanylate cyclase (GGDEF)-like protein
MDTRTTLIVAMFMTLLNSGLLGFMHRGFSPDVRPSAYDWRIGSLLAACGCVLLAVQDLLPLAFILPLGNSCILIAMALYWRATRRFIGVPDNPWIFLPAALGTLGIYWFTAITPDFGMRVLVASCGSAIPLLAGGHTLLAGSKEYRLISQNVLCGLMFSMAFVMFLRIGMILTKQNQAISLLDTNQWANAASIMMIAILPLIGTTVFIAMCSERIRRQWERAASFDFLTNLPNRRMIADTGKQRFDALKDSESSLAVAMIDIDHFKKINDQFGHDFGDQAIKHVAAVLRQQLHSQHLIGRHGGEEFVAILENTALESAHAAAERLRTAIEKTPMSVGGNVQEICISIGVSVLSPVDKTFDNLLLRADRALYSAKEAGRNRVEIDLK